jgi:hypothetical protein
MEMSLHRFRIQDSRIRKMAVWEPAPQVEGLEQYMVYPDGCMKFEHGMCVILLAQELSKLSLFMSLFVKFDTIC